MRLANSGKVVFLEDTGDDVKKKLLYLLVSTRAVIGQFSGPYSPVRPPCCKTVL